MPSSTIFPAIDPAYILSFQFSSWYPLFANQSIKSTIIQPLSRDFKDYLDSDGVYIPEGSEDLPFESELSDDDTEEEEAAEGKKFTFPDLDTKIRECIREYGAVFPKLNFSSPKDAAWVLPASSPLKCTTPAEVYMLLKSSDFVTHDLDAERVFEGCESSEGAETTPYDLELVLRKWYSIDRSRELRCFVRRNRLIGITQRDANFYEFLNDPKTKEYIVSTVACYWELNIKSKWTINEDYVFDFLLTRDLSHGHILDFNPYAPRTDAVLFTYEELNTLHTSGEALKMKVIDFHSHPTAMRNTPAYQHNMIPFEALSLSDGRDVTEFAASWEARIQENINNHN
ncbi:hypothetical protein AMATHDRAFT_136028 [Amanita thiersii Skay4041]|uniref:Uncharacterized protein n=1 Tax=Amanita thiersii Skay4041 TaxID=703135 RepID=A0A2A9P0D7_9AGAR|nr:hypothetical protein AMATHDRAFT_136028 [Amanita thiersii Skay4041]